MRLDLDKPLANVAYALLGAALFVSPYILHFYGMTTETLLGTVVGLVVFAAVVFADNWSQDTIDKLVIAGAAALIVVPVALPQHFGTVPFWLDLGTGASLLLICAIDLWMRKSNLPKNER